jgi:hypothetical protein
MTCLAQIHGCYKAISRARVVVAPLASLLDEELDFRDLSFLEPSFDFLDFDDSLEEFSSHSFSFNGCSAASKLLLDSFRERDELLDFFDLDKSVEQPSVQFRVFDDPSAPSE